MTLLLSGTLKLSRDLSARMLKITLGERSRLAKIELEFNEASGKNAKEVLTTLETRFPWQSWDQDRRKFEQPISHGQQIIEKAISRVISNPKLISSRCQSDLFHECNTKECALSRTHSWIGREERSRTQRNVVEQIQRIASTPKHPNEKSAIRTVNMFPGGALMDLLILNQLFDTAVSTPVILEWCWADTSSKMKHFLDELYRMAACKSCHEFVLDLNESIGNSSEGVPLNFLVDLLRVTILLWCFQRAPLGTTWELRSIWCTDHPLETLTPLGWDFFFSVDYFDQFPETLSSVAEMLLAHPHSPFYTVRTNGLSWSMNSNPLIFVHQGKGSKEEEEEKSSLASVLSGVQQEIQQKETLRQSLIISQNDPSIDYISEDPDGTSWVHFKENGQVPARVTGWRVRLPSSLEIQELMLEGEQSLREDVRQLQQRKTTLQWKWIEDHLCSSGSVRVIRVRSWWGSVCSAFRCLLRMS